MSIIKGLFGGGDNKAAQQASQLQGVANDRQLAEVNRQSALASMSRKAPRGQRLFDRAFSDGPVSATTKLG